MSITSFQRKSPLRSSGTFTLSNQHQQESNSWHPAIDNKTPSFGPRCVQPLSPSVRNSNNALCLSMDKLKYTSLGLYGRDKERSMLENALYKSFHGGTAERQLILISGFSGTGKSALAGSLEKRLKKKGLLARGKYDGNLRDEPYAAITAACATICGHIRFLEKEKPAVFERVCLRIIEDLGSELSLLVDFIPVMGELPGFDGEKQAAQSRSEAGSSSEESKNRFHFACRRFIKSISDEFAPLVLVLDDLQWADTSSLDLLEALLSDHNICHLMVIGTCRSNEANETHVFYQAVKDFREKMEGGVFEMTEIALENLDVTATNEMVKTLLSMDNDERTMRLAEICHERTRGNAFFLLHFITMLHDKKLIQFNLCLMEWVWDIDEVLAKTRISENVVDILKPKMLDYSSHVILILKVAACLGSVFEESTLRLILENMASEFCDNGNCQKVLEDGLMTLEEDGFITNVTNLPNSNFRDFRKMRRVFAWSHDKIHEAAEALNKDMKESSDFKFHVGTIMSSQMTAIELEANIFVIVNLLNQATIAGHDEEAEHENQAILASLNYVASQKAMSISAFESAFVYAKHGIDALPRNKWMHQYKLSLGLYSIGAQTADYLGKVDEMELYCKEVLSIKNIPFEDKLAIYHTMIDNARSRGTPAESAGLAFKVLKRLGCEFPKNSFAVTIGILTNIFKVRSMMKFQNLEGLPECKDTRRYEMMKLMDKLSISLYMMNDSRLALIVFRMHVSTMKFGYNEYSLSALVGIGMILTGVLYDLKGGVVCAEEVLKLMKMSPDSPRKSRALFTLHAFLLPWTKPVIQMQKPLLQAYDMGLQCGDPESSMWSIIFWILCHFIAGNSLEQIESDCGIYLKQMKDLKRVQHLYVTMYIRQMVLNLLGQNDGNYLELVGKAFSQEELVHCKQDGFHKAGIILYQGICLTYFGDHMQQADNAIAWGHDYVEKAYLCAPTIPFDHFLKGVSCFVAAGITKKRKYLKMAEKLRSKIKKWREAGNPNVIHYEYVLDAESAVLKGKQSDAIRNYEAAIIFAGRGGFQHDAAFACERFAEFQLLVMNDRDEAKYRLEQALDYWRKWGALGKVEQLQEKYTDLIMSRDSKDSVLCLSSL